MRLYSAYGHRLYLNTIERHRFEKTARTRPPNIRLLCLVLFYTGCRISEAINLRTHHFQFEEGVISVNTLKKRDNTSVREIPVPDHLLDAIEEYVIETHGNHQTLLWNVHRSAAWRWVKSVMEEAEIMGQQASPKGLRHTFGVHAILCGVPLNVLQKWMGHSSINVTTIYTQVIGPEERKLAQGMW